MDRHVRTRFFGLTRTEWLIALAVLLLVGLLVHPYRAQQASRYALTAAVVERGTVVLDEYEGVVGIDRSVRDGRLYSDKAPGQPMLAVPFFALGRIVGIEDATILRIDGNLGLWWVTLWSSAIPGAALAVMMFRRVREIDAEKALPVTAAVVTGTLLLPFSALLFGHVLAAALLYGAYLLTVGEPSLRRFLGAGLLAGLAVTVEYTAALGVIVLGSHVLIRHRRRVAHFVSGGVLPALGLAAYNTIAFGNPMVLSYQYNAFREVTDTARPLFHMFSSASAENAFRLFFSGRGLAGATPVVLVAVAGAVWMLRRHFQIDAAMAVAMFVAFVSLPLLWGNPWGGESPGPRYITPALPFLAVPLVWAWTRWRLLTLATVIVSTFTMVAATVTDPLLARDTEGGVGIWVLMLVRGEAVNTVLTMGMGGLGWFVHVAAVVLVVVLLIRSRDFEASPTPRVG